MGGCFLACFGSSKDRRRRKPANRSLPRDQRNACYKPLPSSLSPIQETLEKPISQIPEPRVELEEQVSFGTRKKVTFDLNVKTYEQEQEISNCGSGGDKGEEKEKETISEDDSFTPSMASYPSNHRYQNCSNSDDEYEEESDQDDLDDDFDEDDDDDLVVVDGGLIGEGESSESFFSLPTDSQKQGSVATPLGNETEVNSPIPPAREVKTNENTRDRSQYVHSVLNPVENLTQWKAVKAKSTPPLKQQKENFKFEQEPQIPFSSEPTFKPSVFSFNKDNDSNQKEEIAVDTSLSNWLGSCETTPSTKSTSNTYFGFDSAERSNTLQRSNSPTSLEDRPILGALTLQEIKQYSASSSPRKSPSRSPDDMPILGTVGRYWSHTEQAMDSSSGSSCKGGIPNTNSKYREDKRVYWHSTPFETRLERALKTGAADSS